MKSKKTITDPFTFGSFGGFIKDPMWPFKEIVFDGERVYDSSYSDRYEVSEENDLVNLEISLPGVSKKDVDLDVLGDILKVRVSEDTSRKWVKSYSKDFSIGSSLDSETIKASMKDGILSVSFERKSKNKPKKVSIA